MPTQREAPRRREEMKTIEITPEIRERIIAFALALHYASCQPTEEMARFFRMSAERHNLELGWMVRKALHGDAEINAEIKRLINTDRARELILGAWDEPVQLAVALPGEETP